MPGPKYGKWLAGAALAAVVLTVVAGGGRDWGPLGEARAQSEGGGPREHFKIENPADLSNDDASAIYTRLAAKLLKGYRLSGERTVESYQSWRRYNIAPYRSATHGKRFVNNYTNAIGKAYGDFEGAGAMPAGTIVAKDSFAVTTDGGVYSGPLFLMEKMPAGFDPASRDWRYSMIMPDGSIFGVTMGQGAENVAFCVTCHRTAGDANDHLFFLPEQFRSGN
jgi:hypothetical protein